MNQKDMQQLNELLADRPYVGGYLPSKADQETFDKLFAGLVHLKRWVRHYNTFTDAEQALHAKSTPASGACPAKAAPKAAPAKKGGDDDDDDIDLFGSEDDEEAEKAKAERAKQLEAQKKGGKPGVVAKSSVVIDVKVWDDETDLKEVERLVREIKMEGLLWGASKTVPLAFGVSKLQMGCVVEDEKVSVDTLTEMIEELELVQSTDIAAFQKV